ncbi:MAG: hypothetical protein F6K30_22240, partial [Cyanothece sp. SIO2G6]|nr:hypothetical protein [Cyanothece sp. SIO2G6]
MILYPYFKQQSDKRLYAAMVELIADYLIHPDISQLGVTSHGWAIDLMPIVDSSNFDVLPFAISLSPDIVIPTEFSTLPALGSLFEPPTHLAIHKTVRETLQSNALRDSEGWDELSASIDEPMITVSLSDSLPDNLANQEVINHNLLRGNRESGDRPSESSPDNGNGLDGESLDHENLDVTSLDHENLESGIIFEPFTSVLTQELTDGDTENPLPVDGDTENPLPTDDNTENPLPVDGDTENLLPTDGDTENLLPTDDNTENPL